MLLDLKWCLFFVTATAVLRIGNSEHGAAAAGGGYTRHGGRKLAEIPGFISIDCGSNEDNYTNTTRNIPYKSDKGFIDTGIIAETVSGDYNQLSKTLRSFPLEKRNCYTLRPREGKNNKYLIRATFAYGNYDGENKAPVFDLYVGVNKWERVEDKDNIYYEIIHVASTDYIDVCLVNIGQGVPFISILELRHLDFSMYPIKSGGALVLAFGRRDVGGTEVLRYPDDVYDRYWHPRNFSEDGGIKIASNSTINTASSTDEAYGLPAKVMKTAVKTKNVSIPLEVNINNLDLGSKHYCYFHFAEVEKLEPSQQRELTISLDGQRYLTESLKLDYLNPQTIIQDDPPITEVLQFYFSINAAKGTQLPPILSAYEIFKLIELPDKQTATDDVKTIVEIKTRYNVNRN